MDGWMVEYFVSIKILRWYVAMHDSECNVANKVAQYVRTIR